MLACAFNECRGDKYPLVLLGIKSDISLACCGVLDYLSATLTVKLLWVYTEKNFFYTHFYTETPYFIRKYVNGWTYGEIFLFQTHYLVPEWVLGKIFSIQTQKELIDNLPSFCGSDFKLYMGLCGRFCSCTRFRHVNSLF